MKINPRSSLLTKDEKLVKAIRSAMNEFYNEDEKIEIKQKLNEEEWLRLYKNYDKLNGNNSEKK